MSARMLLRSGPSLTRNVGDDLESFVLVLLWVAICHAPNDMAPEERWDVMSMFDTATGKIEALYIS